MNLLLKHQVSLLCVSMGQVLALSRASILSGYRTWHSGLWKINESLIFMNYILIAFLYRTIHCSKFLVSFDLSDHLAALINGKLAGHAEAQRFSFRFRMYWFCFVNKTFEVTELPLPSINRVRKYDKIIYPMGYALCIVFDATIPFLFIFVLTPIGHVFTWHNRADSRFAPCHWVTALLCNDVSHWLGANRESARHKCCGNSSLVKSMLCMITGLNFQ